jgi:NMT1/THI5 like
MTKKKSRLSFRGSKATEESWSGWLKRKAYSAIFRLIERAKSVCEECHDGAQNVSIAVILLVVSLSGRFCHAADSPSKALFAYGAINAYMASTWIAKEQGFFRKHNVEVEPVFIIATQAAQAMLAGEVQIGLIGPTHVVNAVVAGGDMVMIMGNQNKVRYQLVAHPSIKRPEDLKGKKSWDRRQHGRTGHARRDYGLRSCRD